MSGNKIGGERAARTNKLLYGADFYARIGKTGGLAPKTKPHGFLYWKVTGQTEKIRQAGIKGGRKSKRGAADETTTQ